MLVKRTNILFEQETWDMLTAISLQTKKSVGDLVRSAIYKVYLNDARKMQIAEAFDNIIKTRKIFNGKYNYKALIDDGRKY